MSPQVGTAVLALALFGVSCARPGDVETATPPGVPDSVYVEAVNDHFYDARVHAVFGGGTRRTLGTIPGNGGRATVALAWEPRELVFEISFIISGAAYETYPIEVTRGESVELRLPPNIHASGFFKRVISRN